MSDRALVSPDISVPNSDPQHDEKVRALIHRAMEVAERRVEPAGIAVIEFSDCTTVVISKEIPFGEIFTHDRSDIPSTEATLRKQH